MKKLVEMSQLVTDYVDPKSLLNLFKQGSYDPKAYRLLEGIINKKYVNDEQAAFDLYKSSSTAKSYLMLKSRTKERMLNLLFTMDSNKRMKTSYQKALYSCSRNIIAARLLILKGMRNVAVDYLRSALNTSLKFQFTEFQLLSARLLRMHESFVSTETKMNIYRNVIEKSGALLIAEIEMEELWEKIIVQIRKTAAPKEKLQKTISLSFKRAKEILKKHDSYSLWVNYYRVAVYYFHSQNKHEQVLKSIEECERYMKANPVFTDHAFISEMALQKLDTCLYLGNYELGKESAMVCQSIFNPGYINWIIFLEYYFLLCLHTQNYREAQIVFSDAIRHPKFASYPPERLEKWKIFEAFLFYIIPDDAKHRRFNVYKFINEVPIFSKDKRGYNLSIIIAQIALLIKMGDYDKVMDKFNSLKAYASRFVNINRNPRSFYFVKMLMTMLKYDFDPGKTESIAKKFFGKLQKTTMGNQSEIETLEVIPYDILWTDILVKLKSVQEEWVEKRL